MDQKSRFSFGNLWGINEIDRLKVLYLTLSFFFLNSCYAMWRPIKTSIFAKMVGASYVPDAKLYGMFFLIPLIILYSKLIDWLRRHQLMYCFTLFHGIGGLIFYLLLSHDTYGIANTVTNPNRWVGWSFYFFMESFAAFFTTTFWSFADSISDPKEARQYFGILTAGSKIGGILGSGLLYLALSNLNLADTILLPNILLLGSFLLFAAAATTYFLMIKVPGANLHGYESAYQVEKSKSNEPKTFIESLKGSIDGIFVILKNPYVFGIFALVFFYDAIITIFDFLMLQSANAKYETAGELTAFYSFYTLCMHGVGFVIAFLGTVPLQRLLGVRTSLFIAPTVSLALVLTAYFWPTTNILFITFVVLRGLNYGLNHPTREVLYIPTTKIIKFKAKAWTDSFGTRIAKGSASLFNKSIANASPGFILLSSTLASTGLLSLWLVIAYFLGKTLQNAITHNKVIGQEEEA